MLEINKIHHGDCLELMKEIQDKSVDMILCDLPYGTTACKWDTIIPFDKLWTQYERIIKDKGAIVLTASQPFTSFLITSNINLFKYPLIWNKVAVTNPMLAKKQPMRCHEDLLIFYKKQPTYNPIMTEGIMWRRAGKNHKTETLGDSNLINPGNDRTSLKYPKTIITFSNADKTKNIHPTQKPVALFEYLIKTYTNEGDLVLDNCIGSGTTAIACNNLNRNVIGIELDEEYCKIARERYALSQKGNKMIFHSISSHYRIGGKKIRNRHRLTVWIDETIIELRFGNYDYELMWMVDRVIDQEMKLNLKYVKSQEGETK